MISVPPLLRMKPNLFLVSQSDRDRHREEVQMGPGMEVRARASGELEGAERAV
jgi:hypothetical protein